MKSIINIMSSIGYEKTLVIACGEYKLDNYFKYNQSVFIHFLPSRMLQCHDRFETERIRHLVQDMNCTQVVFLGALDETMKERMNASLPMQSLRSSVDFTRKDLIGKNRIMPADTRDNLLLEKHVISQCTQLMDYYFIRESPGKRKISVRGMVADLGEECVKTVFHNGIRFNDTVSMN